MASGNAYLTKPTATSNLLVAEPIATVEASRAAANALRGYAGQRIRFSGKVSGRRLRTLDSKDGAHLCVTTVCDDAGVCLFARLWLVLGPALRVIHPTEGEMITFRATVEKQLDGTYRFTRPTQYQRVEHDAHAPG